MLNLRTPYFITHSTEVFSIILLSAVILSVGCGFRGNIYAEECRPAPMLRSHGSVFLMQLIFRTCYEIYNAFQYWLHQLRKLF